MLPRERLVVVILAIAAFAVRCLHLDREAVEHFDEGIYASVLWYSDPGGGVYPARNLYAPPLLPVMIEAMSWLPGLHEDAPFLPAVVLGTLTVPLLWLVARTWFGAAAGLFAATILAFCDYHIVYSRMAMTDVPCLFWMLLSVWLGSLAVTQSSVRMAMAAGVACGVAWWTKYTGWLPLAIVSSGSVLWWIKFRPDHVRIGRLMVLLGVMSGSSVVVYAPWWWQLQSVGGYAAVSANHAGYLGTADTWTEHLGRQLSLQFLQDGLPGVISLGLGMCGAAVLRWSAAGGFTGNSTLTGGERFPPVRLLIRFLAAALALLILALRIWTPLMLLCLALSGLTGLSLWPVLRKAWWTRLPRGGPSSAATPQAWFHTADRLSAPFIDPALGVCLVACWFAGLLLVTPFYHPYSRLFMPFMASIWLAAAGGVGWWLESNLSVTWHEMNASAFSRRTSFGRQLVASMLAAGVASALVKVDENRRIVLLPADDLAVTPVWTDRSSIRGAADALAELVRTDSASAASGRSDDAQAIVYVYGEPALLYHLHRAGVTAVPVSHLDVRPTAGTSVAAYIAIGPHAKRSDGFWDAWMSRSVFFDWVGEVTYEPGRASLLDLFSPQWLDTHPEALSQLLELHRVKPM